MKCLLSVILLCVLSLPVYSELSDADLDKIRLIVKEEVKTEIDASEKRMKQYVDARINGVEKQITTLTHIIYWVLALIIGAIGVPQIIVAFLYNKDRKLSKQVESNAHEIESLKRSHT